MGVAVGKLLEGYRDQVEKVLEEAIPSFGATGKLQEAIGYALKNGGKRFRPAIVLMVARALGGKSEVSDAALAVEYFHTASLIADDLPCMDDDDERRGVPSLHKAFNEATALLASYALISAGFDRIRANSETIGDAKRGLLAIENASYNTGIFGAVGGQYDDLFPPKPTEETILAVMDKKTGTLFEISFVLGWLFGGGDIEALDDVKRLSTHFGRAFQITDDFLDLDDEDGMNLPRIVGHERAYALLSSEISQLKGKLKMLGLQLPEFLLLVEEMESRVPSSPFCV
ncbi:MAG: Farnesyl diphosphate synthase [Chlamydiae bacterium]|nr:Farnesyl diphosphate synthase [Chlamydiota bacterium]